MPFVRTVIPSTVSMFFPTMLEYSFPKKTRIISKTKTVFVMLPAIEPRTSPLILSLLFLLFKNKSETTIGVSPASILGTKQITKLKTFPLYIAASENGVNRNAVGNAGIMKVQ